MKKFKLKVPRYSFDHEGMIINGELSRCGYKVDVHAGDLCKDNMDIMSKMNIRQCMSEGDSFIWRYILDELEPLEPIKLTRLEYELLKYFSKNFRSKYIVRDKNGALSALGRNPIRPDAFYEPPFSSGWEQIDIFDDCFQFIKWDDSEAYDIQEILENCKVVEDE